LGEFNERFRTLIIDSQLLCFDRAVERLEELIVREEVEGDRSRPGG
jgi:hypothetical protein